MTESCTDLGNARRLVRRHGAIIRYLPPLKAWLIWRGDRWERDQDGGIMRLAKAAALKVYEEVQEATDKTERQELAKWAIQSESAHRLAAMIELAKSEPTIPVLPDALDRDPWWLNVENGTLDLRTGTLRQHDRGDLITKLAGTRWDPAAECPQFLAFLGKIFSQRGDLIGFVQRQVGYALTGVQREQLLFLWYGLGANGKSTLLALLRALLGDYAASVAMATFLHQRSDAIRNDLAALKSVRFVTAVETQADQRLNEGLVKQVTGWDPVTARFLHGEYFTYDPHYKVTLAFNHRPEIRDQSHAMWRRVRLVPFDVTIPDAEQDPALVEKLREELPGILYWAVTGCLAWQRDGFPVPEAVETATKDYREETDVLAGFLDQLCIRAESASAGASELYSAFKPWALETGSPVLSQTKFGKLLREREFTKVKTERGVVWKGLKLSPNGNGNAQSA